MARFGSNFNRRRSSTEDLSKVLSRWNSEERRHFSSFSEFSAFSEFSEVKADSCSGRSKPNYKHSQTVKSEDQVQRYFKHSKSYPGGLSLKSLHSEHRLKEDGRQMSENKEVSFYRPNRIEAEGVIGEEGGLISIRGTQIMLAVPKGALPEGDIQTICIAVVFDDRIKRPSCGRSPRVTPVIELKPDGLKFQIPPRLFVPHCGCLSDVDVNGDVLQVYVADRKSGKDLEWTLQGPEEWASLMPQLTSSVYIIPVPHFTFTDAIIGGKKVTRKKIRFFPVVSCRQNYKISVTMVFCDDTEAAYECIKLTEEASGRPISDTHVSFIVRDTEADLILEVQEVFDSTWKIVSHREIILDFNQLWDENVRGKATFHFRKDREEMTNEAPGFEIYAKQIGQGPKVLLTCLDQNVEELRYRQESITCEAHRGAHPHTAHQTQSCERGLSRVESVSIRDREISQPLAVEVSAIEQRKFHHRQSEQGQMQLMTSRELLWQHFNQQLCPTTDGQWMPYTSKFLMMDPNYRICLPPNNNTFDFPNVRPSFLNYKVCQELKKLDHKCPVGNDWQRLAAELGLDSHIPSFKHQQGLNHIESPAIAIVNIGYQRKKIQNINELLTLLETIERFDVREGVEKCHLERVNCEALAYNPNGGGDNRNAEENRNGLEPRQVTAPVGWAEQNGAFSPFRLPSLSAPQNYQEHPHAAESALLQGFPRGTQRVNSSQSIKEESLVDGGSQRGPGPPFVRYPRATLGPSETAQSFAQSRYNSRQPHSEVSSDVDQSFAQGPNNNVQSQSQGFFGTGQYQSQFNVDSSYPMAHGHLNPGQSWAQGLSDFGNFHAQGPRDGCNPSEFKLDGNKAVVRGTHDGQVMTRPDHFTSGNLQNLEMNSRREQVGGPYAVSEQGPIDKRKIKSSMSTESSSSLEAMSSTPETPCFSEDPWPSKEHGALESFSEEPPHRSPSGHLRSKGDNSGHYEEGGDLVDS